MTTVKPRAAPIRALRDEASNAATSAKRFGELAKHPSKSVRLEVANNPAAPWRVLVALAEDENEQIRLNAAGSVSGVPEAETRLSTSKDKWVRAILAHDRSRKPNALKRSVQLRLAKDDFRETRQRIAETTDQLDLFERFMADPDPSMRAHCAANPRIDRDQMERLITDKAAGVRAVAVAVGCLYPDEEQLLRLASDPSGAVQAWILQRADVPLSIIELIAAEGNERNRSRAADILAEPERHRNARNVAYRAAERARARPGEFVRPVAQ